MELEKQNQLGDEKMEFCDYYILEKSYTLKFELVSMCPADCLGMLMQTYGVQCILKLMVDDLISLLS